MTDSPAPLSPPPQEPDSGRHQVLPLFTPVPRKCDRSNGWKPQVQQAFIEALAETGSVKAACRRVNRADHGAYLLRRHPDAEEFRKAWDAALDIGLRRIEDIAMDRAINGVEVPVYSYGKLIGTRTTYNDRLLMFILRNRAPERFGGALRQRGGAHGPNAVDEMERQRLKREWQREWEAEARQKSATTSEEAAQGINSTLERMRAHWLAQMGPRTREAYEAYRRAEAEESGEDWQPLDWPALEDHSEPDPERGDDED